MAEIKSLAHNFFLFKFLSVLLSLSDTQVHILECPDKTNSGWTWKKTHPILTKTISTETLKAVGEVTWKMSRHETLNYNITQNVSAQSVALNMIIKLKLYT